MQTYNLTLLPDGAVIRVPEGQTILEALRGAGLAPDAPCGGRGACKKCGVILDGREVLACQTAVDRDMAVTRKLSAKAEILTRALAAQTKPDGRNRYVLAFDIGTTTVVAYLLDGKNGALLAAGSTLNPQTTFGADVISRIEYVMKNGPEQMQQSILGAMGRLTKEVSVKSGVAPEQITLAAVVGNTAMHHLFLGIDPRPLTVPPYMPRVSQALVVPADGLLPIAKDGKVRVLPNIAGFVGADTVGCLLSTRFDQLPGTALLIDIGTNGEMALTANGRRAACSTAAGPAFEGAKISCGMRGAAGAIDHVRLEDGRLACSVIGGGTARGLCGSGLLDAVTALLACGMLDPGGRLNAGSGEKGRWIKKDNMDAVVLKDGVALTQKDIREVQLAKAAIRAGIELLAKKLGVAVESIENVYLAGAFGNYLSPASACAIGMIPPCLLGRITPIGNAAGEGARLAALSEEEYEYSSRLAKGTEFLELASMPEFQDCYVDCLSFGEGEEWE
jgi:uncharacterized 2Fe-2S/4Fe-4S cluster protein (DUF4445 family)